MWHITELPRQIAANAETEEEEPQWHLEKEDTVDEIYRACRCGLQLGQVDHKLPQQQNCQRLSKGVVLTRLV